MAKVVCAYIVLCVLFDDSADEYYPADACDGLPVIDICPGGQTVPTQPSIDFVPDVLRGHGFVAMAASDPVELLATRAAPCPSVPVLITR